MSIRHCIATGLFLSVTLLFPACSTSQPTPPSPAVEPSKESQSSSNAALAPTQATVAMKDFQFVPASITMQKGATITWTNEDSAPHTTTGDAGGPSSGTLAKGQSYSYTFDTSGTFPYHCSFHPRMTGIVTVTP